MNDVVLFPGQGSQSADMRAAVERHVPELGRRAAALVGGNVFDRADEGSRYLQPALYCAALAGWHALRRQRPEVLKGDGGIAVAGHSLGEIAALAAAGAIDVDEGLGLVALRGRLFDEGSMGPAHGGMLAILGPNAEHAAAASGIGGLTVANNNCPGQVVISGRLQHIAQLERFATEVGFRVRRLPLRVAAHSPLMADIAAKFAAALARASIRQPAVPVWSSSTACPFDDVRQRLADGISSPVRFRELLEGLYEAGARNFVETGPGTVLTKLVRRTLSGIEAEAVDLTAGLGSRTHAVDRKRRAYV